MYLNASIGGDLGLDCKNRYIGRMEGEKEGKQDGKEGRKDIV